MPAAIPKWMKLSMCLASLPGMYSSSWKPLTSPANWQLMPEASKRVIGAMPDLPASRLAQPSETVLPTGLMSPRPVMTTRRRVMRWGRCGRLSGLGVCLGVVDRQLHGGDLLGFFVGDLDAELVFEGHHQL